MVVSFNDVRNETVADRLFIISENRYFANGELTAEPAATTMKPRCYIRSIVNVRRISNLLLLFGVRRTSGDFRRFIPGVQKRGGPRSCGTRKPQFSHLKYNSCAYSNIYVTKYGYSYSFCNTMLCKTVTTDALQKTTALCKINILAFHIDCFTVSAFGSPQEILLISFNLLVFFQVHLN